MQKNIFIFFVGLIFFSSQNVCSQTFGFGCLGFVGGYGGFTYQEFDAKGLNEFIQSWNSLEFPHESMNEFSFATGYRVGLNFFRATFENNIILTAKGYYQSLDKTNKAKLGDTNSDDYYTLDMDMKNWAVGIDVGWEFTRIVSWKIVDGAIHFNNIMLTESMDTPAETTVNKYESDAGVIGYSIGTGIIISIIKDYVSIEGLAGYTYLSVDDLKNNEGNYFLRAIPDAANISLDYSNFIESGGFTAVVQLNVGFPIL